MEDLEKSLSNHNDPKKTTDDIITVKHLDSTLIASGEGIQSLIGGTDIKVYHSHWYVYIFLVQFDDMFIHFLC